MIWLLLLAEKYFSLSLLPGSFLPRLRRHTRNENRLNQLYLQHASDAIQIMDSSGRIVQANERLAKLLGCFSSSLIDMPLSQWIAFWPDEKLPPKYFQHLQSVTTPTHIETFVLRKDGTRIPVEVSASSFVLSDEKFVYASIRDISVRQKTEMALLDNEENLRVLFDMLPVGLLQTNDQGECMEFNKTLLRITGYDASEGKDFNFHQIAQAGQAGLVEKEFVCKDSSKVLLRLHGVRIGARDGSDCNWTVIEDITVNRQSENSQRLAAGVFTSSYQGIVVTDASTRVIDVNPAFSRITGYSRDEFLGHTPALLRSGRHDAAFFVQLWDSLCKKDFWQGEIWNRRKNGEVYAQMQSITVIRDESGQLMHYVAVFFDISQQKQHAEELHSTANYDALTSLPNRRLMTDRLHQALADASRTARTLAVCYLDIDGFKSVNDKLGQAVGDSLLVTLSERINAVLRNEDTLARLGGDEFVLLLADRGEADEYESILQRVLAAVSTPVTLGSTKVTVSASIGVALFPDEDAEADTLLRRANQAMYSAKEAGKNRFHLFDQTQDRQAKAAKDTVQHLRHALTHGEFVLHYQPQVDLLTGAIIGAEALIRWQHPQRGLLPPSEFLGYLEGNDLEIAVGEWVIQQVLEQIADWNAQGLFFKVGVNISPAHLLSPHFAERLGLSIGLNPGVSALSLELEILETAALADLQHAVQVLTQCRELGVSFSLDDFGTGYSSLTYFRTLPVDTLKVDQSFVRDILVDPHDLGIVETLIRLAQAFERQLIAEGVETLEHASKLVSVGCRFGQGYGIARPMPADEMVPWVYQWGSRKPWLQWSPGTVS